MPIVDADSLGVEFELDSEIAAAINEDDGDLN